MIGAKSLLHSLITLVDPVGEATACHRQLQKGPLDQPWEIAAEIRHSDQAFSDYFCQILCVGPLFRHECSEGFAFGVAYVEQQVQTSDS